MQLLMRRQGRRVKRQMYSDAHSAFNEGDRGVEEARREAGKKGAGTYP